MVSLKGFGRAKGTHRARLTQLNTKPPFDGKLRFRCVKCMPKASDGVTRNQELACGDEMERSRARSARVLHCKKD